MKVYEDTVAEQVRIENAIKKYGWAAEHNFWWYQCYQHWYAPTQRTIFVETDRGALLTVRIERSKEYFVVFDPLAAAEDRTPLLMEYVDWIFSHTDAKKIWFQLAKPARHDFLSHLSDECRSNRIYYTLTSPIYNLKEFDPTLPGGHYKTLRKEMHKFYREHHVEIRDAKIYVDHESLNAIAENWKLKRPNHERGMAGVYHHMIDNNFEGTDEARVFIVDGKATGINAGWMIPNSDRYYGSVGIHDFSVDNLGAMLYLEDLVWLKQHGYNEVDMGGSEKSLLAFKNKFRPQSFEEMVIFSVVKKSEKIANRVEIALR
jgi:hypothetical protein